MDEPTSTLSRISASAAVDSLGWRYLLGAITTSVAVPTMFAGINALRVATEACGEYAEEHLRADLRSGRVELTLHTPALLAVSDVDVALARAITSTLQHEGLATSALPLAGTRTSVQSIEIAIDAMDIGAVLPFWRAVLGYQNEPGSDESIIDPDRQGAAVWFQQLDGPRPQRNRIHLDLTVPHDEADARIAAALAAGGTLLSDRRARAFWILADPEGNEVCVCTWQDRDQTD